MPKLDLDYAEPQNVEKTVMNLRSLQEHPGWLLVESIVYANIEYLKDQVLEGIEGETKETIDRLRDKIKIHRDIIKTPKDIIKQLTPDSQSLEESDDPYYVVDDNLQDMP